MIFEFNKTKYLLGQLGFITILLIITLFLWAMGKQLIAMCFLAFSVLCILSTALKLLSAKAGKLDVRVGEDGILLKQKKIAWSDLTVKDHKISSSRNDSTVDIRFNHYSPQFKSLIDKKCNLDIE